MVTYWSDDNGLTYYDYLLSRYNYAPTTLMFLIGFQRIFGDTGLSDMLTVPEILISEGKVKDFTTKSVYSDIQKYLASIEEVFVEDTQMVFDIYALRELFADMNFSFEKDCTVPYILLNSNNAKRIYDGFSIKPPERPKEPVRTTDMSDAEWEALYNEYLKSYSAWESEYNKWLLAYNSLNHKLRYQFAQGVLYGCVQLGYNWLPFSGTDTSWYKGSFQELVKSSAETIYIEGVDVLGKEPDTKSYPLGENELFNYLPDSKDEDWDFGGMDESSFTGENDSHGQHDSKDEEILETDVYAIAVCRTDMGYDFNVSYYEEAHPLIVKFETDTDDMLFVDTMVDTIDDFDLLP